MASAEEENPDRPGCYNGPQQLEWAEFIETSTKAHAELFPKIFTQGGQNQWKAVNVDFPQIPYDKREFDNVDKAFSWYHVFVRGKEITNTEHATREETLAMDFYEISFQLFDIARMRVQLFDRYEELEQAKIQLIQNRFNISINSKLLQYRRDSTESKEKDILEIYQKYNAALNEFEFIQNDFKCLSKQVASAENKAFNEKFNKNAFINYHVYMKEGKVKGQPIETFLEEQEKLWGELLVSMQKVPIKTNNITMKDKTEIDPQTQFNRKFDNLKKTCNKIQEVICEAGLERLDLALSDIKTMRGKVIDVQSNFEIKVTEEQEFFLNGIEALVDLIGNQRRSIIDKRESEKEEKRVNAHSNIKSLGSIQMESLTGYNDYLTWKQSVTVLNTHTDEYKRCAALRTTLKNTEDKERCKDIWDYKKLLQVLKDKYEHHEILVPALLKKLSDLPRAENDNMLLRNIGIIMNVHSQLESLSELALSRFDQTIISMLVSKMTEECQSWFDTLNFLTERVGTKGENQGQDLDDKQSTVSGSSLGTGVLPVDPDGDQVKRMREEFIKFIAMKETIINKKRARNLPIIEDQKKCHKCKSVPKYCKCNKKNDVYNVETDQDVTCVVCKRNGKHTNRFNKETTSLSACPEFKKMGLDEKRKAANQARACYVCLKPGHNKTSCTITNNCVKCKKARHHPSLCLQDTETEGEEKEAHSIGKKSRTVLITSEGLAWDQRLNCQEKITIFSDIGANINLIKNSTAEKLGLKVIKRTSITMRLVSFSKKIWTNLYKVMLIDRAGQHHQIEAYGIEKVINDRVPIAASVITKIAQSFNVEVEEINNIGGEIDLLLSADCLALLPVPTQMVVGNFGLWESKFGKKYVIVGKLNQDEDVKSPADLRSIVDPISDDKEVYQVEASTESCAFTRLLENNDIIKTLKVLCRVMETFKRENKVGKGSFKVTSMAYDMSAAFNMLLKFNRNSIDEGMGRTKQLDVFEENGILYTNMRFTEEIMQNCFQKDKLPVVAGKSRLGRLLMMAAHKSKTGLVQGEMHCGLKQTLVNSRAHPVLGAYITYGKQVAKGIIYNCVICRKMAKKLTEAKMDKRKGGFGEMPKDPKNAGAFGNIAIDYFGPFLCRPPKGRETRGTRHHKIYGMAVLCQNTRAVAFYPVEGYDLISFQTAFRIHTNVYGIPEKILSDPMKAFVAGAKAMDSESQLKEKELEEFENILSKEYGIKWEIIPPGSQWRNPTERTIKSLKEMMTSIFNNKNKQAPVLTIQEYTLIFSDCAEMLNRRPIQGYLAEGELCFISPNTLLLGRPTKYPVKGEAEMTITERQELIHGLRERFWKGIQEIIIKDSRMFKYPKWYDTKRPPQVDDVILVLYKSRVSESYRIGIITKVLDHHNIECRVSPAQDSSLTSFKKSAIMQIPVQRTVLLYAKDLEQ